jgi:hypothetical protein
MSKELIKAPQDNSDVKYTVENNIEYTAITNNPVIKDGIQGSLKSCYFIMLKSIRCTTSVVDGTLTYTIDNNTLLEKLNTALTKTERIYISERLNKTRANVFLLVMATTGGNDKYAIYRLNSIGFNKNIEQDETGKIKRNHVYFYDADVSLVTPLFRKKKQKIYIKHNIDNPYWLICDEIPVIEINEDCCFYKLNTIKPATKSMVDKAINTKTLALKNRLSTTGIRKNIVNAITKAVKNGYLQITLKGKILSESDRMYLIAYGYSIAESDNETTISWVQTNG